MRLVVDDENTAGRGIGKTHAMDATFLCFSAWKEEDHGAAAGGTSPQVATV
jgi:hypothetical protein